MSTPAFPLDREALQLIAQIGFIGAESGQVPAARAIFQSLLALRPDSNVPYLGLATCELASDRPEPAVQILREQGLARLPGDPELTAYLGLALRCAGKEAEAREFLAAAREGDAGQPHVRLAEKLLAQGGGSAR
jgi:predicted Zn-dependent protease